MLRVFVFNAHPRRRARKTDVVRTVRRVLSGERRQDATVSVVFIDDAFCGRINREYLHHRGSTDVISFLLDEKGLEGEVYVNLDRAREQAAAYEVSVPNEITRLVVHGTLHLLGYDDGSVSLRRRMKDREDHYVDALAPKGRRVRKA